MLPQVRQFGCHICGDGSWHSEASNPTSKEVCATDVAVMSVNGTTSGQHAQSGPRKSVGRYNLGRLEVVRQDQCVRERILHPEGETG